MNSNDFLLAAPEILVFLMACVIMCWDVFLREDRRGIIHMLAMVTLIFAAIITLRGGGVAMEGPDGVTAFNGHFIRDSMG